MRNAVLAFAMSVLACSGAMAVDRGVTSPPFGFGARTAPPPPPNAVTIFNNIDWAHPTALYNCCNGYGIAGPHNLIGAHLLFDGMGFTPQTSLKVTEIDVAAAYGSGTNRFSLALYNDNAGVPGAALKVWTFTNLPPYGGCCALAQAFDSVGIPVVAGHRYWVVMRTDRLSQDSTMFWNTSVLNPMTQLPFTQYCSNDVQGTPCTTPNDQWSSATIAPGLAFAVFGTP